MTSQHQYPSSLILQPTNLVRNEIDKNGFHFLFNQDEFILTEGSILNGWKMEILIASIHFYLPGTFKSFWIAYKPQVQKYSKDDTFKFPSHEKTILNKLLDEYGFKCDGNVGADEFPFGIYQYVKSLCGDRWYYDGGLYMYYNVVIPKDWHVEISYRVKYASCRIFDPNNDEKYHFITDYKTLYVTR